MVKPISPYLLRPLRSLTDMLDQLNGRTSGGTESNPPVTPPEPAGPAGATSAPAPRDIVTLAGVEQPVEPTTAVQPRQVDIKA